LGFSCGVDGAPTVAEANGTETVVMTVSAGVWAACGAIDVSLDAGSEVVIRATCLWVSFPGPSVSGDVPEPTAPPVVSVAVATICDVPVDCG
jgi:hypothetical protein